MKSLIALLLSVLLASCDNSQPTNSEEQPGLKIISLGRDSVYWGETSWLVLNEPRNSTEGLQLFVRTYMMMIDSCIDGKLYFRSEEGAESGTFRLYDSNKVVGGEQHINFLQHSVKFDSHLNYLGQYVLIAGDEMPVEVDRLPWRKGDVEYFLGNVRLEEQDTITSGIKTFIVPTNATSGMLRARIIHDSIDIAPIKIFAHAGLYLTERRIGSAEIRIENLFGKMRIKEQGSYSESSWLVGSITQPFSDLDDVMLDGDTLRLQQEKSNGGHFEIDLAITEDEIGLLSGRVRIVSLDALLEDGTEIAITFQKLPWRLIDGNYESVVYGEGIGSQLTSIKYKRLAAGQVMEEIIEYTGANEASSFTLRFGK